MKNLTVNEVMKIADVSHAVAHQIMYGFLDTKKIYTERGEFAKYAVHFFTNKFNATWAEGNDAPKGGKSGEFVIMVSHNKSYIEFAQKLIEADNAKGCMRKELEEKRKAAIDAMNIEEDERIKFVSMTLNKSITQVKKTAHNFAAKKLGFYSVEGRDKFLQLLKTPKQN